MLHIYMHLMFMWRKCIMLLRIKFISLYLYYFIQLYIYFYQTQLFTHLSHKTVHQVLCSTHSVADKLIDLQPNMIPNIVKMHWVHKKKFRGKKKIVVIISFWDIFHLITLITMYYSSYFIVILYKYTHKCIKDRNQYMHNYPI